METGIQRNYIVNFSYQQLISIVEQMEQTEKNLFFDYFRDDILKYIFEYTKLNNLPQSHLVELEKRLQKIEDGNGLFIDGEVVFNEIENRLNEL